MGVWIAVGMVVTWVVCFTLFPVLQRLFDCPTRGVKESPDRLERFYERFVEFLPGFTYRYRWALVIVPVVICVAGAIALFGLSGRLAPMKVEVDAIEYVNKDMPLYRDMRYFEKSVSGLSVARVWVKTAKGGVIDPELLRGLEAFSRDLEKNPYVASALGPTSILRMKRFLGGKSDQLPTDPDGFAEATSDLEQLLISEVEFQGFIDTKTLSNANIMVITHGSDYAEFEKLINGINEAWAKNREANPALKEASIQVVGQSVLQSKIGANLVPTLTESFALTAVLIFLTFLVVFRNGAARLMAMIPSLFAILATFLAMRLFGGSLNVATIILATTVLGTTENDQIHFFYHLQEGQKGGASMEKALRHSLLISGRAIIFATLINAAGFIALAPSGLPLLRQFGVVTALAFLLSMVADFTALPAALWILFREKPDGARDPQVPPEAPVTQPPATA
ncbi:MAG: MMPL family transporter [Myxococcales bacterium]